VPQKKGEVPPEIAERLLELQAEAERVEDERDRAVYEAMKAGASYRAVTEVIPISFGKIRQICEAHGYPDDEEKARRKARDDESDAWRKRAGLPPVKRHRIQ